MKRFTGAVLMTIAVLSLIIYTAEQGQSGTSPAYAEDRQVVEMCREYPADINETPSRAPSPSPTDGNRWEIELDAVEIDMIARITMLEAAGEPDEGQQAVVEVILNRMKSADFPDSVYEVLSQKIHGRLQFSSWTRRNAMAPSEQVRENVEKVLRGRTNILPFETVYFSVSGENENVQIQIGNHVFCNQY